MSPEISVTRKRIGERWYVCQRCGIETPEGDCIVQNGLIVCFGPNTRNCRDIPGHAAAMRKWQGVHERVPSPAPEESTDL